MSTYTQILYQIVFTTKNKKATLIESGQENLFKYIWGILKNKKCHLYRIGGVENHLHIITNIHPSVSVAHFSGWQSGYGAFTYSISAKDNLIDYVKNQKEHHKKVSFRDEYISLLKEHGIIFEEKYLV